MSENPDFYHINMEINYKYIDENIIKDRYDKKKNRYLCTLIYFVNCR